MASLALLLVGMDRGAFAPRAESAPAAARGSRTLVAWAQRVRRSGGGRSGTRAPVAETRNQGVRAGGPPAARAAAGCCARRWRQQQDWSVWCGGRTPVLPVHVSTACGVLTWPAAVVCASSGDNSGCCVRDARRASCRPDAVATAVRSMCYVCDALPVCCTCASSNACVDGPVPGRAWQSVRLLRCRPALLGAHYRPPRSAGHGGQPRRPCVQLRRQRPKLAGPFGRAR